MKLKLAEQDAVTILSLLLDAQEKISDAQISVLRAGLNKLAVAGKKRIILDLTQASTVIDAAANAKFQALMGQIPDPKTPVDLIVASSLGPVTTIGEGVEVLNSGLLAQTLQLDQLRRRRDRLQALQEKAKTRLQDLGADPVAIAIKDLKQRNARLRRDTRLIEKILIAWRTQLRTDVVLIAAPGEDPTLERRETIRKLLQNLFVEKKYFESLDQAPAVGGSP